MAKVLISIEDALLKRIDRMAKSRGLSRSAYLAQSAERDMLLVSGRAAGAAQRALNRLDRLFAASPSTESTAAIRSERDGR